MLLKGKSGSSGVGFGVLQFYRRNAPVIKKKHVKDVRAEVERFESARALAMVQLAKMAVDTENKLGQENSLLFEIHQMMLSDYDYHNSIVKLIQAEKVCAEYAVQMVTQSITRVFARVEDSYLRGRDADVQDVSRRVLQILSGREQPTQDIGSRMRIIAANNLSPSEIAGFDRGNLMGILLQDGNPESHSSIFARALRIPCVLGLGPQLNTSLEGRQIAIDADEALVYIEPDETILKQMIHKQDMQRLQYIQQQGNLQNQEEGYRKNAIQTNTGESGRL